MSRSVNSEDKVEFPELALGASPVLDKTRLMSRIMTFSGFGTRLLPLFLNASPKSAGAHALMPG